MELGCGSFVEMEWPYFFFLFIVNGRIITHSMPGPSAYFFLRPVTLPQPGNSRASTSISSITKMPSSSLICLLAVIVASRENRWLHLLVLVHLGILNWIVVNSPRAMEQRSIPDLHRGVDGDFQISSSRIWTYDQSVNSRPLYHWATEEQREIRSHRVPFPFSTHDQYELEASFVTPGTSS